MKEKRFSAGKFIVYLILIFWALTTIYPLTWVFLNSFKDKKQIMSNSFALPMRDLFTTDNYGNAFQKLNIFGAYRNSLIISWQRGGSRDPFCGNGFLRAGALQLPGQKASE